MLSGVYYYIEVLVNYDLWMRGKKQPSFAILLITLCVFLYSLFLIGVRIISAKNPCIDASRKVYIISITLFKLEFAIIGRGTILQCFEFVTFELVKTNS